MTVAIIFQTSSILGLIQSIPIPMPQKTMKRKTDLIRRASLMAYPHVTVYGGANCLTMKNYTFVYYFGKNRAIHDKKYHPHALCREKRRKCMIRICAAGKIMCLRTDCGDIHVDQEHGEKPTMIILISLLLSLSPAAGQAGEITLTIPPGINLNRDEIKVHVPGAAPAGNPRGRIEIVIYYFSEGIEKIVYNENSMQESTHRGTIRALVKLKREGVLRRALFIDAEGRNREDILKNFSLKLSAALSGR